jgi:hypothetical protein
VWSCWKIQPAANHLLQDLVPLSHSEICEEITLKIMKELNFMQHPLGKHITQMEISALHIFYDRTDQEFSIFDISHHCKEQDFEICAIQLVTKTANLIILSLYRAPSGDALDATLKYLYKPKSEFIICGDINNLNENNQKNK